MWNHDDTPAGSNMVCRTYLNIKEGLRLINPIISIQIQLPSVILSRQFLGISSTSNLEK